MAGGSIELSGLTKRFSEIAVDNGGSVTRKVSLRMTAIAGRPPASLEIGGDLTSLHVQLDRAPVPIALSLDVPPGRHLVQFRSDGKPVVAPNDPRVMVWRAENPVLEELP